MHDIRAKWFDGNEELKDTHKVRREVFIAEQGVSEEIELDDKDVISKHLVVYDGEKAIATARIFVDGDSVRMGRIAVLKDYRGYCYGDLVMELCLKKAEEMGFKKSILSSQTHVKGFYERFGFIGCSDVYVKANIEHIDMERN